MMECNWLSCIPPIPSKHIAINKELYLFSQRRNWLHSEKCFMIKCCFLASITYNPFLVIWFPLTYHSLLLQMSHRWQILSTSLKGQKACSIIGCRPNPAFNRVKRSWEQPKGSPEARCMTEREKTYLTYSVFDFFCFRNF